MKMSNETYDLLKRICMLYFPAVTALWLALSEIWGLPYGAEIGATLAALNTALGTCLGISSTNYYKEGGE